MRRGKHEALIFSPPSAQNEPESVAPEPAPRATLYQEPTEEVLLLGAMLRDVQLMEEKLKRLFANAGYRGELRVILGAANRVCQCCAKLLGEEKA